MQLTLSWMIVLTLTTPAWAHSKTSHQSEVMPTEHAEVPRKQGILVTENNDTIHSHSHIHVRESECLASTDGYILSYDQNTALGVATYTFDFYENSEIENIQRFSTIFRHSAVNKHV